MLTDLLGYIEFDSPVSFEVSFPHIHRNCIVTTELKNEGCLRQDIARFSVTIFLLPPLDELEKESNRKNASLWSCCCLMHEFMVQENW